MPPPRGFLPFVAVALVLIMSPMIFMRNPAETYMNLLGTRGLRREAKMSIPWVTEGEPREPAHVRVVIRTHAREQLQLRSLIYGLRAQSEGQAGFKADFVLVPTEPASYQTYQRLCNEMNVGFDDLYLVELPDTFYEDVKLRNSRLTCTDAVRTRYVREFNADEVHRYCDFDHYVYYAATDEALATFVLPCRSCTHVLVTNGDNGYAPSFLRETVRQSADLAIVGFTHRNQAQTPVLGVGGLDLGAVLMRVGVLDHGRRLFLSSLPVDAGPKEVHDADYWMVVNALERGLSFAVCKNQLLMYHN